MLVEHYTLVPGKLFAGEFPGHPNPATSLARLASLAEEGVRTFLDLTPVEDPLEPYEEQLAEVMPGLRYFRHPIPDMGIPSSPAVMRGILDRIAEETAAGHPVYFHCWGGIGRTGTVAGCWFREQGLGGDAALDAVQKLYSTMPKSERFSTPTSPQTPVQFDYVRRWAK
ncbi:protein-tyrosine phosphatase family protein [Luteolibacter sp. LG18]|uniref:protein-tyrosine phosphatase family protein n=1 Tax=Luteolibacter sp. LG18 TaxID=2819286 RepID=UPI002B2AB8FC|nr:phosphatase [Luteolibacter sp. LG18]